MAETYWTPSGAARQASDYYNSLPYEEKVKLAPLLENYRQMGMAEALDLLQGDQDHLRNRITAIRNRGLQIP